MLEIQSIVDDLGSKWTAGGRLTEQPKNKSGRSCLKLESPKWLKVHGLQKETAPASKIEWSTNMP